MKAKDDKVAKLAKQVEDLTTNAKESSDALSEVKKLRDELAGKDVTHALQGAGCINEKAAKALLGDYEGAVEKLKEACLYWVRGGRGARAPSSWDHPRACGEQLPSGFTYTDVKGSSPHARGAPWSGRAPPRTAGDHPRMRGEHAQLEQEVSSRPGIIPACAGSTCAVQWLEELDQGSSPHARGAPSRRSATTATPWDHPRMRGEHAAELAEELVVDGIIPACAGSTVTDTRLGRYLRGSSPHARGAPTPRPPTCSPPRDHPRMRGEHDDVADAVHVLVGIIPACAGSTAGTGATMTAVGGSSPHARGAHRVANGVDAVVVGSAPHARGARRRRPRQASRRWDHPRMRGEHA